jgi:hypothetical protein
MGPAEHEGPFPKIGAINFTTKDLQINSNKCD